MMPLPEETYSAILSKVKTGATLMNAVRSAKISGTTFYKHVDRVQHESLAGWVSTQFNFNIDNFKEKDREFIIYFFSHFDALTMEQAYNRARIQRLFCYVMWYRCHQDLKETHRRIRIPYGRVLRNITAYLKSEKDVYLRELGERLASVVQQRISTLQTK